MIKAPSEVEDSKSNLYGRSMPGQLITVPDISSTSLKPKKPNKTVLTSIMGEKKKPREAPLIEGFSLKTPRLIKRILKRIRK